MATAIVNVLGVIAGVLGIYGFAQTNFGARDEKGATIRVQVALESPETVTEAGGDLPDARLFNLNGEFLGLTVDPGDVDGGEFQEFTVDIPNQQPAYTLFSANDDAICIALVTIVWPDDQKYAWTGGFARLCGLDWFFSNIIPAGDFGERKLECMWIDANGDQPYTGFQVYWPAYAPEAGDDVPAPPETYCEDDTVFSIKTEEDPTVVLFNPPTNPPARRLRRRATPLKNPSLVVSEDPAQSAVELCDSPSSWGPDFLNIHDGYLCETSKKQLHPICDDIVTDDCFNVKSKQLIRGGIATRDEGYTKVIDWTNGTWADM